MSSHNLNDNISDSFTFILDGNTYEMRYPKTRELEKIQVITNELKEKEGDDKAVEELNNQMLDTLYSFITPVDHNVAIKEALQDTNVRVLKRFNEMIKEELSV